jgi:predicted CXXCH cytochrome family protein
MKRASLFVPAVFVTVLGVMALGQIIPGDTNSYPSVSVINTAHNLNNYPGVNIPGNQVCLPCHTPHNAMEVDGENFVLWNHAETNQTFDMYQTTHNPTSLQPQGPSKLCLSCHDGVTAIDSYGGTTGSIVMTGNAALGTDLRNDHPIGMRYPTNLPSDYNNPTSFAPGIGGGEGVKLVTINGNDRVECNSCHNVHNNGLGNFLRVPIQESYLCLQCHIK